MTAPAPSPNDYTHWLAVLKTLIRTSRVKASLAVNRELVMLYWRIGSEIIARQTQQGWGAKVIEQLANDLRSEFPDMKGLSRSNLMYMRAFAESWPDEAIVHQLGGQIPWRHNCLILDKFKDPELRKWICWRRKMGRTDASHFKHPKSAKQSILRNRSAPVIPALSRDPWLQRCVHGSGFMDCVSSPNTVNFSPRLSSWTRSGIHAFCGAGRARSHGLRVKPAMTGRGSVRLLIHSLNLTLAQ